MRTRDFGDAFYSLIALAESLNINLETALDGALVKYRARLTVQGHTGSAHHPETRPDKEKIDIDER